MSHTKNGHDWEQVASERANYIYIYIYIILHNLKITQYQCAISRLHNIFCLHNNITTFLCKNDVMLLFTRTTGERCSLPKYSIHNVLTVLVKPAITFNALSHLSPVLLLPTRIIFIPFSRVTVLLVWQPLSQNRSKQNLSKVSCCWLIDDILSIVDRIMTPWEQKATYKLFPIPQAVNGMLEMVPHPASCQRHAWGQKFGDCTISRLRKCTVQSQDCTNVLRNLKIECTISRLHKFLNCVKHIYKNKNIKNVTRWL